MFFYIVLFIMTYSLYLLNSRSTTTLYLATFLLVLHLKHHSLFLLIFAQLFDSLFELLLSQSRYFLLVYFCVICHLGYNHRRCSWFLRYIYVILGIVRIFTFISVNNLHLYIFTIIIVFNIIFIVMIIISIWVILLCTPDIILTDNCWLLLVSAVATTRFVVTYCLINITLHVYLRCIRINVMTYILLFLLRS